MNGLGLILLFMGSLLPLVWLGGKKEPLPLPEEEVGGELTEFTVTIE